MALRSLQGAQYSGLMLQGMGGLGKSSTAARLLERLPDYEPIVFFREIDGPKLERSLFNQCLSEQGKAILESKLDLRQKLTKFFDQGLNHPKQRLVFVLDDFEANLEIKSGDRAVLKSKDSDVIEVIDALLEALRQCQTPHRVLITSRYDVQFPHQNDSIYRIPLASLKDADLRKKCDRLEGFQSQGERSENQKNAIALGDGNPRLLEWLDKVLLNPSIESSQILEKLAQAETEFRENILAEQLLNQQSREARMLLTRMQIFELPVPFEAVAAICSEIENLESHCQKAIALGLLEWNGVDQSNYRLPRIFESLLDPVEDISIYTQGTEALYQAWWKEQDITEAQALELIRLATVAEHYDIEDEVSSRIGLVWEKQGRYREAGHLWEKINTQRQLHLGNEHPSVATSINNLAGLYESQGRYQDAEPLYALAVTLLFQTLGDQHPTTQTVFRNFIQCLSTALKAGQDSRLSEHPLTQAILNQLRSADS